jgi:hypothetical protein
VRLLVGTKNIVFYGDDSWNQLLIVHALENIEVQ